MNVKAGADGKGSYVDSPHLRRLLARLTLTSVLSTRELQVVAAAAMRGLDTKGTAAELGISPKTVDEIWRRIYRKFRCHSRVEVLSCLLVSSFRLLAAAGSVLEEWRPSPRNAARKDFTDGIVGEPRRTFAVVRARRT